MISMYSAYIPMICDSGVLQTTAMTKQRLVYVFHLLASSLDSLLDQREMSTGSN